jgi:hypothetical protein
VLLIPNTPYAVDNSMITLHNSTTYGVLLSAYGRRDCDVFLTSQPENTAVAYWVH